MVTRWRDQNGNTIEVISITLTGDNRDGEWFVARYPSGRSIPSINNERGWYRTMEELQDAGIDIASLKEVRRVLKWIWEEVGNDNRKSSAEADRRHGRCRPGIRPGA